MQTHNLGKRVSDELEITMNLACYISGILDGQNSDALKQAKDALLSNHNLITNLHNELERKTRGKQ